MLGLGNGFIHLLTDTCQILRVELRTWVALNGQPSRPSCRKHREEPQNVSNLAKQRSAMPAHHVNVQSDAQNWIEHLKATFCRL